MELLELMVHAAAIRLDIFGMTTYIPRHESPNPYYGRTNQGLTLIQYYGCPGSIGTPLGKWAVDGGGSDRFNDWLPKAQEKYGLVLLRPTVRLSSGEYGPMWAITKGIDGTPLPEVSLPETSAMFSSDCEEHTYESLSETWTNIEPCLVNWKGGE